MDHLPEAQITEEVPGVAKTSFQAENPNHDPFAVLDVPMCPYLDLAQTSCPRLNSGLAFSLGFPSSNQFRGQVRASFPCRRAIADPFNAIVCGAIQCLLARKLADGKGSVVPIQTESFSPGVYALWAPVTQDKFRAILPKLAFRFPSWVIVFVKIPPVGQQIDLTVFGLVVRYSLDPVLPRALFTLRRGVLFLSFFVTATLGGWAGRVWVESELV